MALEVVGSVLRYYGIESYDDPSENFIKIKCPIHGSDSVGNSIIYKNTGVWLCFSGGCHKRSAKTIVGLISSVMKRNGSSGSFDSVKNFLLKLRQNKKTRIHPVKNIQIPEKKPLFFDEKNMPPCSFPSNYYLSKRSFSQDTLSYFGVGDCQEGIMKNRAVIPVRYIDGRYMGFSARSHFDKCLQCKHYHSVDSACINASDRESAISKKWYHSKGLRKTTTLYNIQNIRPSSAIAMVEGPSCVWRLHEFGIPAVACLGKDIDELQLKLLDSLNIKKILFMPDSDESGKEFLTRFIKDYYTRYSISVANFGNYKDITEMDNESLKENIVKVWNKIC